MAQWIPKTAWKVSNINKRYGQQYVARGYPTTQDVDRCLVSYAAVASLQKEAIKAKVLSALKSNARNPLAGGAVVIDLRDAPERKLQPLPQRGVVALHHHDILSGAAAPILPGNKSAAELFLVASTEQRAINSATALRRWGYNRITVAEYGLVKEALDGVGANMETDERT